MQGYEQIVRQDGIHKLVVGAEHTVLATSSGTLYAWGSDEVPTLNLGGTLRKCVFRFENICFVANPRNLENHLDKCSYLQDARYVIHTITFFCSFVS